MLFNRELSRSKPPVFIFLVLLLLFFRISECKSLPFFLQLLLSQHLLLYFALRVFLIFLLSLINLLHKVFGMLLLLLLMYLPFSFINIHEPIHRPADTCPRVFVNLIINTLSLILLIRQMHLIIPLHLIPTEVFLHNHGIELFRR